MDKPKCIICGNKLELTGESEVVCKYCETKQRVPEKYRKITDNNQNNSNNQINGHEEKIYREAVNLIQEASTYADYMKIVSMLKQIPGYKNSSRLLEQCTGKAHSYDNDNTYFIGKSLMDTGDYKRALAEFSKIRGWRDSDVQIQICCEKLNGGNTNKKNGKKGLIVALIAVILIIACVAGVSASKYFIPKAKYDNAMRLYVDGEYEEASRIFEELDGFKDSDEMQKKSDEKIEEFSEDKGDKPVDPPNEPTDKPTVKPTIKPTEKPIKKDKVYRCDNINSRSYYSSKFDVGQSHVVALYGETALADGYNKDGQCDTAAWSDLVGIFSGYYHTIGLKSDGTVIATGKNDDGQCDVSDWRDVADVSAGFSFSLGLKKDGTVLAAGSEYACGDATSWSDIIQISAGFNYGVGLKSDGTVVTSTDGLVGECDVESWRDIVAVSAGYEHTVGLKSDGTVVVTGANDYGQCDVTGWKDIVDISAGWYGTVGLKSDGTIVVAGDYDNQAIEEATGWTDVVSVKAGSDYDIRALKSDGTILTTGYEKVSDWNLF